jgi:hypothetical protein
VCLCVCLFILGLSHVSTWLHDSLSLDHLLLVAMAPGSSPPEIATPLANKSYLICPPATNQTQVLLICWEVGEGGQ